MTHNKTGGKIVKCIFCKRPIHINDYGGEVKEGFFHNWLPCLIALKDKYMNNSHQGNI